MTSNKFEYDVCRTCLQTDGPLICIYNSKAAGMLRECNFSSVSENDGLPNKICSTCLQALEQCYNFKQLCTQSEHTYRSTLRKTIKDNEKTQSTCHFSTNIKCEEDTTEDLSLDGIEFKTDFIKNTFSFCMDKSRTDESYNDLSDSEDLSQEDFTSFLDKPLPQPLPHQCSQCTQSFNDERDLKIHQSVHNPNLICEICTKKFTGRPSLKRHVKTHLRQKPHICNICGKGFSESYALVKHLRFHSGIPREKKHVCQECGRRFSEPYYLKLHLRKHTGERPLVCRTCKKSFADPRSFRIHIQIHSEDKRFKCNVCEKGFTQKANLEKHLRIHTGERPFICKSCNKTFSQAVTLEKHLNSHSKMKVIVCTQCNKQYTVRSAFEKHVCKGQTSI